MVLAKLQNTRSIYKTQLYFFVCTSHYNQKLKFKNHLQQYKIWNRLRIWQKMWKTRIVKKILIRKIKEKYRGRQDIYHVRVTLKNQYEDALFPKTIYRFNTIPINILVGFFVETDKMIWQFIRYYREPKVLIILKEKVVGLMPPDFNTYYKVTVIIKTTWYWHQGTQIH